MMCRLIKILPIYWFRIWGPPRWWQCQRYRLHRKKVRKFSHDSRRKQKCQQICIPGAVQKCHKMEWPKSKNVRNFSGNKMAREFKTMKFWFLSKILIYWNHRSFLTFLDPFSVIFGLGSISGHFCIYETFWRTFWFLRIWPYAVMPRHAVR